MTIRVTNAENGINEEFKSNNLDFIRRSYTEFDDVQKMSEEDYKKLAILIVKKRYTDTRFDNLEWTVTTEND
ncbi:MAG TPA: hypothetical protein PLH27_01305 [bacterium]|nr:hypothetical protein [bacterium]HMW36276.1 hypothetical protein [bacterium]HMZ04098.1 hypothetical protein [bacterium]HNC47596.1 hypothetical protein [bacterium]HND77669.1 hypothetical protein [bacterium]